MLNTCKSNGKHGKQRFQWKTGLDILRILLKERGTFEKADIGGAWLSSACAVRLPVISRRKVRMTSSYHAPYALGDTHAIMAGIKGRYPMRVRSLVQVQDGPTAPPKRIEEASDYFMHAPLGSGGYNSVGRVPLL
ncbi:hypothetical protein BC332_24109 [Capsicum chinense]|nr:hypothetical protein BC332_24109 [Capsicum chinense]